MVAVVEQLKGALGESGLLILPCVASHIIQVISQASFTLNLLKNLTTDISQSKPLLFSCINVLHFVADNHRLFSCEHVDPERSAFK